jgi:hypothetical protein
MYKNGKVVSVETISGMGVVGDKEEWWKGWFQVWYIWHVIKTFMNATMYLQTAQTFLKK